MCAFYTLLMKVKKRPVLRKISRNSVKCLGITKYLLRIRMWRSCLKTGVKAIVVGKVHLVLE